MDVNEIKNDVGAVLSKEIAALRTHHLTLSLLNVLVFGAVLFAGVWMYMHTEANHAAEMARLEMQYQQYQKSDDARYATLLQHATEREQASQQQIVIRERVADATSKAETTASQVTAPDRTTEQIIADSQKFLSVTPLHTPDNLLAFPTNAVQVFVADKIRLDACTQNLTDTRHDLGLEIGKAGSLSADLDSCNKQVTAANALLKDQDKQLHKGKWKRVGEVAEKVGIAVVGILIGKGL
jgi:hypothetical protein